MSKPTASEAANLLTGYDEIAIRKHFPGIKIYTADEETSPDVLRALVFVNRRRAPFNQTDKEAKDFALSRNLTELQDEFATDPVNEDGTESHPISEPGKDSEPNAQ